MAKPRPEIDVEMKIRTVETPLWASDCISRLSWHRITRNTQRPARTLLG